jgi:23S rRNA pseudouridine2457 synthase
MLIALNKPYGVICQFSASGRHATLAKWITQPDVYPAGRLDHDSEGLLLLTDEGPLQNAIAAPDAGLVKRYWCQVEGVPVPGALERLANGVTWGKGLFARAAARAIEPANLWQRQPAIRVRRARPTSWIEIAVSEGRNRQVRHMTAVIGHPTLRLVRVGIGLLDLFELGLEPGDSRTISAAQLGLPARGRGRSSFRT